MWHILIFSPWPSDAVDSLKLAFTASFSHKWGGGGCVGEHNTGNTLTLKTGVSFSMKHSPTCITDIFSPRGDHERAVYVGDTGWSAPQLYCAMVPFATRAPTKACFRGLAYGAWQSDLTRNTKPSRQNKSQCSYFTWLAWNKSVNYRWVIT